ncbi:MAG: RHS repeat-associated core domain-containing protein [Bacteroidota bacterium]
MRIGTMVRSLDEAMGLYDYGARYYDPAIARWGQVDPAAEKHAPWSPYNYVNGNPLSRIDPQGDTIRIIGNEEFSRQAVQDISNIVMSGEAGHDLIYYLNTHESDVIISEATASGIFSYFDKQNIRATEATVTGDGTET